MRVELPPVRFAAGDLLQHVSRVAYRGTALYFGRNGANRYDATARDYGVLYLGLDLPTALMESVFHKHHWDRDTNRSIALAEVQSRLVRVVATTTDLDLADLTAESVMAGRFGLNLEQFTGRDYTYTQRLSAEVFGMVAAGNVPRFDGVLYPSRNNYPGRAIALFDRAGKKVRVVADIDLIDHVDWPLFVEKYDIGVEPLT